MSYAKKKKLWNSTGQHMTTRLLRSIIRDKDFHKKIDKWCYDRKMSTYKQQRCWWAYMQEHPDELDKFWNGEDW